MVENILFISRQEFERLEKLGLGTILNYKLDKIMLLQGFILIPQDYSNFEMGVVSNGEQEIN